MSTQADLGRPPPHSLEAEQSLLAACLIDGGETIDRAVEARLTPAAFYSPAHRRLFEILVDLRHQGKPVAVDVLMEELRADGELQAIGGMGFILQVSEKVPTTASAVYFIEQVRELHLRRQMIAAAGAAVEGAHRGESSSASLLEQLDGLRENAAFASVTLRARLEAARLDPDAEPPRAREIFRLKNATIATPGNLVAITGQSKAGKTAFIGAMLGATMGPDGDFLGASGFNTAGHAVVHVDTEQSPRDHWMVIQTALRRAGLKTAPSWLHSYGLAGWSIGERREALEPMLRLAKAAHGGIYSLFLDGVADFVPDPNDGEICFPFVDSLQALAVKFDCCVVAGLHLNPGSGENFKSRGHLGSHLERRAESNLILEKDIETGRTVIFSNGKQRHAPVLKADGPCFKWDEKEQMHVSTETVRAERDADTADRARELAAEVFAGRGGLTYSAVIAGIKTGCGCCDRTADKRFKEMHTHKAIIRCPPNLWTLAA